MRWYETGPTGMPKAVYAWETWSFILSGGLVAMLLLYDACRTRSLTRKSHPKGSSAAARQSLTHLPTPQAIQLQQTVEVTVEKGEKIAEEEKMWRNPSRFA